jgi:AsmA protein
LIRKKLIVITAVTVSGVLAVFAIAVSLLVNIDHFRPQLARALGAALGREVAIGHISLSVLSGSAVVDDLSIADDPAFARAPFVTAKSVRVGVALLPLITTKHLRIESLRLHEPHLIMRRSGSGVWNFSTLGAAAPAKAQAGPPAASSLTLSIDRLAITDGQVVIETAAARAARAAYEALNIDVRDFSTSGRFRFSGRVKTPGGGTLKLSGQGGPIDSGGLGSIPFEATIDAAALDIKRSGFVDPAAGLAGLVDLHLQATSNGARLNASGTLRGDKLQLVPGASPATQPIEMAYASDYDLSKQEGVVRRGDLRVGRAAARILGRFSTRAETPAVHLTMAGHHMPVSDLQALLPAVGATLPRGARFTRGVLDVDLTAKGPVDRLVIDGPIVMTDAALSGFDLGSHMQKVASFAGVRGSSETTIQTLRVNLRVAPDGIRADGLTCVAPAVGRLEGAGTIAPNNALDFHMRATLNHATGVAGQAVRLVSFGRPDAGVPFRITGTTTAPVFVPDVGRAASDAVKDPGTRSKATGFMRSLFHKDKP